MKINVIFLFLSLFVTNVVYAGSPVNINTADAEEIAESLDGVGLKKAESIVKYREQIGTFQTLDELANVNGIGKKTLELNRDYLIFTNDQESDATPSK